MSGNMTSGPRDRAFCNHGTDSRQHVEVRVPQGLKRPSVKALSRAERPSQAISIAPWEIFAQEHTALTTSTIPNKLANSLRYAPWSSGCPGTMFSPMIDMSVLLRMVNPEVPNLSLKEPSLTARAVPAVMEAMSGPRFAGKAYSRMAQFDE
jgi:hypothetical protein